MTQFQSTIHVDMFVIIEQSCIMLQYMIFNQLGPAEVLVIALVTALAPYVRLKRCSRSAGNKQLVHL